jgi:hypothetical protein
VLHSPALLLLLVGAAARQGLQVQPLAAEPPLSAAERNRLALREAAATLLYRLQGRMGSRSPNR